MLYTILLIQTSLVALFLFFSSSVVASIPRQWEYVSPAAPPAPYHDPDSAEPAPAAPVSVFDGAWLEFTFRDYTQINRYSFVLIDEGCYMLIC